MSTVPVQNQKTNLGWWQSVARMGRLYWTRFFVCFGLLCGILLSKPLWLTARHFPLVPAFSRLPAIAYPLDYICLLGMIFLLVMIAVSSSPRIYILVLLVMLAVLGLFDQGRWQPWAYQYFVMLLVLGGVRWRDGRVVDEYATLNIFRLMMASIYLYSGLQKFNPNFAGHVLPRLAGNEAGVTVAAGVLAILPPIVEAAIGVGLLIRKVRPIAVLGAVAMHAMILVKLGPFGLNYNSVVWPWNVAMIAFDLLLFWKADFSFSDVLWNNKLAIQKVVLVLVLVMPFFSFLGWWDSYLSWSLYTGNVDGGNIFCSNLVAGQLPDYVQPYIAHVSDNNNQLTIRKWALGEMNVPPYPESRIYRAVGAAVCRMTNNSPELALYVRRKATILHADQVTRYNCLDLTTQP
jgi:uncharacterized membrane protein YphA (DoxX/SURF4 family)